MKNSPLALAGAAALAVGLSAGAALAAPDVVKDPNDTKGKLDIRLASSNPQPDGTVDHTITTYTRWKSTYLRGAGPDRYVCFYLWDENGPPKPGEHDLQMCASYSRGKLRGAATRFVNGRSLQTTQVPVSRGGRKKITFHMPAEELSLEDYHWLAVTRDGASINQFDIAPGKGPRKETR